MKKTAEAARDTIHEGKQTQEVPPGARWMWLGLFIFVLAWGFVFSIIQPPGGPADEDGHKAYVKFLATQHRLPRWEPVGGGEAWYESQHPPLYYTAAALVYSLTPGLPDFWRWQIVRWLSLVIGVLILWVAKQFSLEYFHNRFAPAFAATAAFGLTPTVLLHASYVNVDILSVLFCSLVLWMCLRLSRGTVSARHRIVLSAAFGLGLITKMTILGAIPIIILAHAWDPLVQRSKEREQRMVRFLLTVLGATAIGGWWYARNSFLYKTPFIHTIGRFGSGAELIARAGQSVWLVWFTVRETSLSLWAQRGWLHPGFIEISLYTVMIALILLAAWQGTRRWFGRGVEAVSSDPAGWLAGLLLLTLIVGHQLQVWFVDYEFNAGGRYLMNGLLAIQALVVSGLARTRGGNKWLILWVGVFLIMDVVSARRISTVLNPEYAPGWQMFHPRP